MGYSTDFRGSLNFDKPLTKDMVETYKKFANQRHEDGYQPNGKPSICGFFVHESVSGILL